MTNLASVALGFSMYSNILAFPQLLMAPTETGYGFGQTMVTAGIALAPAGLVMMALSPVSARITTRFGARVTLGCGAVLVGLGYLMAYVLYQEVWHIVGARCSSAPVWASPTPRCPRSSWAPCRCASPPRPTASTP